MFTKVKLTSVVVTAALFASSQVQAQELPTQNAVVEVVDQAITVMQGKLQQHLEEQFQQVFEHSVTEDQIAPQKQSKPQEELVEQHAVKQQGELVTLVYPVE